MAIDTTPQNAATEASKVLRTKALAVLRDGRLTVLRAACQLDDYTRPVVFTARVRSSRQGGPTYAVDLREGRWTCTCNGETCGHVAAAQLVAGVSS